MKLQVLKLSVAILILPILISCCDETTYFLSITDLESRVLVSEGFNTIEYNDQTIIDKEDFIIEVEITLVENMASYEVNRIKSNRTKFVQAAIVPCEDQVFINENKIETIIVEFIDIENNNERIDITNQLVTVGSQQTISEILSETNGNIGGFQIEFSDTTGLPKTIEYDIEASLNNGNTIHTKGGIVMFN